MALMSAGMMPASGLVPPTIDVAGQFQQGRQDAAVNQSNDLANEAAQLEVLATGAAYAMPDGPNGAVDPDKWNEVLDTYEASGMPPEKVKAFRDNPNMAAVLLKGSTRALAASNDAALFDLEKQKLEAEIAKAASGGETFRDLTPDEVKLRGLPAGSYQEGSDGKLYQVGGSGQTINVGDNGQRIGTIPPGMAVVEDPTNPSGYRLEAIPGSDAYNERLATDEAGAAKEERTNLKADVVVQDIDRALEQITADPFWTTGVGSQMTGWVGGSPAKNVEKLINTVKATAGFEELQAMRDASPTGGALGSVTPRELEMLQSTIGSLEQDQSPEQLTDNLKRVKNVYLDIIHGEGNGPPREKLGFEDKGADSGAAPETKVLDGKTYVKRGDDWFETE